MLILTGKVVDLSTRQAGRPGAEWTEHVMHVLEGRRVHDVKAGKDFGAAPAIGDDVAFEVWPRMFVTSNGAPGMQFTANARCDVEPLGLRSVG